MTISGARPSGRRTVSVCCAGVERTSIGGVRAARRVCAIGDSGLHAFGCGDGGASPGELSGVWKTDGEGRAIRGVRCVGVASPEGGETSGRPDGGMGIDEGGIPAFIALGVACNGYGRTDGADDIGLVLSEVGATAWTEVSSEASSFIR